MKRHRTAAVAMRNIGRAKVLHMAAPLAGAVPSYLPEVAGFRQRHALKTADGFRVSAIAASPPERALLPDKEQPAPMNVSEYFDRLYGNRDRYWWREDARYSTDPVAHRTSLLTQMTLRAIAGRGPGRALDIGAGEGADSIRMALLGYAVEAVEISRIGAAKIRRFAAEAGVADRIRVEVADITTYVPRGSFDVILCNGVLQYVEDKKTVIGLMQGTTVADGINVISLWSTYTEVPDCHKTVDIFCDDEDGVVYGLYQDWTIEVLYFDRDKTESSHAGMPPHSHSHIKLIARRPR